MESVRKVKTYLVWNYKSHNMSVFFVCLLFLALLVYFSSMMLLITFKMFIILIKSFQLRANIICSYWTRCPNLTGKSGDVILVTVTTLLFTLIGTVIIRLAVNMKFSIYIHIHRFSVDIHGYIHIHRPLCRVHVAPRFLQHTAVQKRLFPPPPKNDADIPLLNL